MDKTKLFPHQIIDKNIDLPYENIYDLLLKQTEKNGNKVFLISPSNKKEEAFTYDIFNKECLEVAKYLISLKLKKGDRINFIIPNSSAFILLYFAAIRLGITVVPINQDIASREMLFIILNSESKAIFYEKSLGFKVNEIKQQINPNTIIEAFPVYSEFHELKTKTNGIELPQYRNTLTDEAVIIYTSGTTGNPKGVILSHLNLLSDAKAINDWFRFSNNTRTLCILPLFHNNGQVVTLLAPLYAGGSTVIADNKASLLAFWDLINIYEINFTSVMASILSILLSIPVERKDKSMKGIICGGQVLTRNVQNSFEKRFNVPVIEGFGLTETTSFSCFNDFPPNNMKVGSIGKPLPINEMAIMGENDSELKANEEGEICIKGYNVANCYLNLPERNLNSFRNNWFHSGDYGYKDEDGYFYFRCRKDNLIIKGGENIYPAELENTLYLNNNVAEAAVIGIPDKLLGQEIVAFIKLKDNCEITEVELKNFCKSNIGKFKQPKRIIIINNMDNIDDIPKGPTKKILYNKLLDFYLTQIDK